MGSSPITNATAGTTILASLFNKITAAMNVNMVPRNSSGVAGDAVGSLGETGLHWLQAYINTLFLGSTHRVRLSQDSNQFVISLDLTGGGTYTEISRFTSTGINAASIATDLITTAMVQTYTHMAVVNKTTTGSHVVSSSAKSAGQLIMVQACGGGGGGGGGVGGTNGGGGGGGAPVLTGFLAVTNGESVSITIGAGGVGGATTVVGAEGSATTVVAASATLTFPGGYGGGSGTPTGGLSRLGSTIGGDGAGGGSASAGTRSQYAPGAAGGSGTNAGGGGGASFGTGGVGGTSGNAGAAGAANTGGGGGGGGQGSSGGDGGTGFVKIIYTSL